MPWVRCEVMRAGPAENGIIYIGLKNVDGSFNHWFQAVPAMKKEILATALSAMSMGRQVVANLTGTTQYSTINRLYVYTAIEVKFQAIFFDLHNTLVEGPIPNGPWELMPGAAGLITELRERAVRLGIITNTPSHWTRADLEARMVEPDFLGGFEVVLLSSQAQVSKPNPAIYNYALSLLPNPPPVSHTAFVTETLSHIANDVDSPSEGARAVGMAGVHLSDGTPSPMADYTVADLPSIINIV